MQNANRGYENPYPQENQHLMNTHRMLLKRDVIDAAGFASNQASKASATETKT